MIKQIFVCLLVCLLEGYMYEYNLWIDYCISVVCFLLLNKNRSYNEWSSPSRHLNTMLQSLKSVETIGN